MARGLPLKPLAVSRDMCEELASMARSRSLPAGLVRRAEIVLLCAEGLDNATGAERLRVSRQTVGKMQLGERHRAVAWGIHPAVDVHSKSLDFGRVESPLDEHRTVACLTLWDEVRRNAAGMPGKLLRQ